MGNWNWFSQPLVHTVIGMTRANPVPVFQPPGKDNFLVELFTIYFPKSRLGIILVYRVIEIKAILVYTIYNCVKNMPKPNESITLLSN